jgi:hypothetical protein
MKRNRYKKTKIFEIGHDVNSDTFIGYSVTGLIKRLSQYKLLNTPAAQYFAKIGWKHVKIRLIENYPCLNQRAARKRVLELAQELKPTLNVKLGIKFNGMTHYQRNRERKKAQTLAFYHKKTPERKAADNMKRGGHCDLCNVDYNYRHGHIKGKKHLANVTSTICTFCKYYVPKKDWQKHRVSVAHLERGNEEINRYAEEMKLNQKLGYVFDDCGCPDDCKMHNRILE